MMTRTFNLPGRVVVSALAMVLVSGAGFAADKTSISKTTKTAQKRVTQTTTTAATKTTEPAKKVETKIETVQAPVAVSPVPSVAPAAPAPTSAAVLSETISAPKSDAKIEAAIEFRPSWTTAKGNSGTENNGELGYSFNKNSYLGYRQQFNTNIYGNADNLNGQMSDGFVRGDFKDLLVNSRVGLSFGYEPRAYLPTAGTYRDNGGILSVRNYLKLKKTLSTRTSLTLMEIPIFHFYNVSGTAANGANPGFENRVYLVFDWSIVPGKLDFSFPLMLNSVKYRDYALGAKNSGATDNQVWIYPELDYSVTKNFILGLAYYTDGYLMKPDLSGFTIKEGLESGVAQLVLRAQL